MAFPKKRRPKQDPKKRVKIQALFWLDPAMAKSLKRTAARLKVSQSELVREAFAHLEEQKLWDGIAKRALALRARQVNTPPAGASEAA